MVLGHFGDADDTLTSQTVKRNQQQYNLPLKILSYDELYGWTMDAIVEQIGRKNNCKLYTRRFLHPASSCVQVHFAACFAGKHLIEARHHSMSITL